MKTILSFLLVILYSFALSQNLTKDAIFFNKQAKEYEKWLLESDFKKIVIYQEIEITNDKIILNLAINSDLEWFGLKKSYNPENSTAIPELLFARMLHLFELPNECAEIRITDYKKYFVNIAYKDNKLVVIEPNPKGVVKNDITIPVVKINNLKKQTTQDVIESNVENVKNRIEAYLKKYYKEKTARFSNAKVKIWQDETSVYANISNITKEIIYDNLLGYWELIDIIIKVEQIEDNVKINYTLQGKYGAGIFTAPRQNDYMDMEKEYKAYIDSYNEQLKANIRKELLKKN